MIRGARAVMEWFKFRCAGGAPSYVHRPSGETLARDPGERPLPWLARLAAFTLAHPAATEVRASRRSPVLRLASDTPGGDRTVFAPGERLRVVDASGRRFECVTVAGVQPPLPMFDDEVASYLTDDGLVVSWDWTCERWRLDDPERPGLFAVRDCRPCRKSR